VSEPAGAPEAEAAGMSAASRFRVICEIIESAHLPGNHHRLVLEAPEIARLARPGQFVHVWCHPPEQIDRPPCAAVLRRPYSISRVWGPNRIVILMRVRGVGGSLLAARRAGERLDIIGPLGRGFAVAEGTRTAVVVAGGIGLAPVPLLLEWLAVHGIRTILLAGAADDSKLPFLVERPPGRPATLPELEELGAEVTFASESVEGVLVSDLLEMRLSELAHAHTQVFAIGPRAMLKRLAAICEGCLELQVSLEERMACGLGACRSCVVPARSAEGTAYKTVCRDGPVFDAREIDWERLTT